MTLIKVGIVIDKYKGLQQKFINGLQQNTYYLVALLRSISGFDVSYVLVIEDTLKQSKINQQELGDDTPLVELERLDPKLPNPVVYDILIHTEAYIPKPFIQEIKSCFPTKVVNFLAGIVMFGLMEDIVFNVENRYVGALPYYPPSLIDEYWMSPHHSYHKTYVETITKSPAVITPYIYEPWFLQKLEKQRRSNVPDFDPYYRPNRNKNIAVLEPNIDLVKNAVIPLCIVESLYTADPKKLREKKVRVYGSLRLHERQSFQHLFKYFTQKSLFTSESRYPIVDVLHYDCDVVISHQHLCELNYLYLDALYYNIPLVHNSDMMRDYGYYYPDFDIQKGAKALEVALHTHDSRIEEYKQQSQKALHQFSVKNKKNILGYEAIIKSLLNR